MKTKQIVAIVVACAVVIATGIIGLRASGALGSGAEPLQDYVSVIYITGTIGDVSYDIYGNEVSLSADTILNYLDRIAGDRRNKGVFLAIDSPGGAVYESDKIYQALMEYKERTGRPIKAACASQMCSGAYYIACAADEITAERTADVGSIGVYIEMMDVSELCAKLGVSVDYIRSSDNKAMGNMYNPLTEEQRAIFQSTVDECYERFLDIVQTARGYGREELRAIADGRSYTATQGLENGLIDAVSEWDDSLWDFKDALGVDAEDYPYVASEDWLSRLIGSVAAALPQSEADALSALLEKKNEVMYYAG